MKDYITNFIKIGVGILFLTGMFSLVIVLRDCTKEECPGKGNVIVNKATWDSIKAISNRPPVVHYDTVKIKGDIVFITTPLPKSVPSKKDSTVNVYKDSLVNEDINVWTTYSIRGTLVNRTWDYIPLKTTIIKTVEKFIPKVVDNPIPVPQNGLYLYGLTGGNKNTFLFGAGADIITKKKTVYGLIYQRNGSENIYSIKLGIKIGK